MYHYIEFYLILRAIFNRTVLLSTKFSPTRLRLKSTKLIAETEAFMHNDSLEVTYVI